jgi:hypothetical protein
LLLKYPYSFLPKGFFVNQGSPYFGLDKCLFIKVLIPSAPVRGFVLFKDHTSYRRFIAQKTSEMIKYIIISKKMRLFKNGTAVAQTVLSWIM